MTDAATKFFSEAETDTPNPLLHKATGTIRFDIADGDDVETWVMNVEQGTVAVSRDDIEATCRVQLTTKLFERLATGRANAMAAMIRGEIAYEGDTTLLLLFQRMLPGPPDSSGPRFVVRDAGGLS